MIGRNRELKQLNALLNKGSASFVVIQGRRRIGKSRLAQEFAKGFSSFQFMGMAEDPNITAEMQRAEFARQLAAQTKKPELNSNDWGNLWSGLAEATREGRHIIVLDEISWMGSKDPSFLPKLKTAWDREFSRNPELILMVCGSVSAWIQKNILSSTAFLGRPSLYLHLNELPLMDCNAFFGEEGHLLSAYEKLKILSLTGGVPRYLELIDPRESAESNIRRLCFVKDSVLSKEFDFIFNDIFGKRSRMYKALLAHIMDHKQNLMEVLSAYQKNKTGSYSEYLKDLVLAGFVSREPGFNVKGETYSRLAYYRIKDNYLRFYLKNIEPYLPQIEADQLRNANVTALSGWFATLGLQFESLVLNNRNQVIELMGIPFEDLIFSGPYIQRATQRKKACQIDLLIETRYKTLYICEIKFSKNKIGMEVIDEVKEKCARIAAAKHSSIRPVLIHVNGVTEGVEDARFFSNIIDFSELLLN